MKPFCTPVRSRRGFTVAELMISVTLLLLVVGGVVSLNLFALRLHQIIRVKLEAGGEARRAVTQLVEDVRTAKRVLVGQGNAMSFAEVADGLPQLGGALQLYPTVSTQSFVRYYLNGTNQTLYRIATGEAAPLAMATSVSNTVAFSAEDHLGNVLTNARNNRVIGLNLELFELHSPPGTHGLSDYFKIQTRVTRRALE